MKHALISQRDEEIHFYFHNDGGHPSDLSSSGSSGSNSDPDDDGDSSSDSSWGPSDSSHQSYSSDSGFSGSDSDHIDDGISDVIRENVGDPGDMFEACVFCGTLKLKPILYPVPSPGEISLKSLCCHGGKVDVEEESDPSPAAECILDLWTRNDHVAYVFKKYARKINNAFSLVSLYAKEEMPGRYNPSYKVRGKTYMRMGALLPGEQQEQPALSQIYIYDADSDTERVDVRLGYLKLGQDVPQVDRQILETCL